MRFVYRGRHFRNLTGQAGSNWRLGENLILTFQTFNLIRPFVVGRVRSSTEVDRPFVW